MSERLLAPGLDPMTRQIWAGLLAARRVASLAFASLAAPAWLALRLLSVAVAYYLAARLGLLIPYVGTHVSLVWLPTGIAIAAYLRWGGIMSASVLAAAFAINF